MSRERRVIRPYQGVEEIQRRLESIRLEVGARSLEPGGLATATTQEFLAQPVCVVLGDDDAARTDFAQAMKECVQQAGLGPADVDLLVTLHTPRLKMSTLAWRCAIDDLAGARSRVNLTAGGRPAPLCTPVGGCTVSVYVALRREIDREPLRPWRKGTWLAKLQFKIKTNVNEVGFTPMELTDEERQRHDLPADVLRYAVVDEPLIPGGGPESIILYIDQAVLAELAASPRSGAARALQVELFLTAMSAVVTRASIQLNSDEKDLTLDQIEDSVVAKLIGVLVGDTTAADQGDHEQRFFKMLRSNPAQFLAHVEALVPDFRKTMVGNLQGGTR